MKKTTWIIVKTRKVNEDYLKIKVLMDSWKESNSEMIIKSLEAHDEVIIAIKTYRSMIKAFTKDLTYLNNLGIKGEIMD